jgi:hypothetical protein
MRFFSDYWVVYKISQQMVFAFPIGRIPREGEFGEESWDSFCFEKPPSVMGVCRAAESEAVRKRLCCGGSE